ncbi:endo-1 3, partial [Phtheirospermum japonicum]
RQIADKVGAAGYYTLVPNYFKGDPFVSNDPKKLLKDWFKRHLPEKGIDDAKPLIQALKSKGITKIGAAGFCWGGKVTVDLTKTPDVQAAVLLHPTGVTVQDIEGVKVPISFLGGQNDSSASPSLLKQFESALKAKRPEVHSFVKIFPGAKHGWTTKYNDTDTAAVNRAAEAHKDLLNWFDMYLK